MLQQLTVENYTLIKHLSIGFKRGFTVITGETGAGKSILIGALSLLLGQRADSGSLSNPDKKCIIEGLFNGRGYGLQDFFENHELDFDGSVIIRREITPSGKSRAFVNDTPVTLNVLKELGQKLVDIHSQHAILALNDPAFQLSICDEYADNTELLREYKAMFMMFQQLSLRLQQWKNEEAQAAKEQDYLSFLYDELAKAGLQAEEKNQLEEEQKILSHAEEIKSILVQIKHLLSHDDANLLTWLSSLPGLLHKISPFHKDAQQLAERSESVLIELKDIDREIEILDQSVVYDPVKLDQVNERLSLIYRLEQKHQVQSVEELLQIMDGLKERLNNIVSLEEKIRGLEKQIELNRQQLAQLEHSLHQSRSKVIDPVSEKLTGLVRELGMPEAVVKLKLEQLDRPGPDGGDSVSILFNANKGGKLKEVSAIASGGELSRLMLSVKYLLSEKKKLPTLIFDEIDVGISGEIAAKMGAMMSKMSGSMQLFTITHLPQIAGKAPNHILVYKESDDEITRSNIRSLSGEERVTEIAKMLSDETVSEVSLMKARELLQQNKI